MEQTKSPDFALKEAVNQRIKYKTSQEALNKIKEAVERKADTNKPAYHDFSPLQVAVAKNDLELVKLLLEFKADATKVDAKNGTLLHLLFNKHNLNPNLKIAKLLIRNGCLLSKKHLENYYLPVHCAALYSSSPLNAVHFCLSQYYPDNPADILELMITAIQRSVYEDTDPELLECIIYHTAVKNPKNRLETLQNIINSKDIHANIELLNSFANASPNIKSQRFIKNCTEVLLLLTTLTNPSQSKAEVKLNEIIQKYSYLFYKSDFEQHLKAKSVDLYKHAANTIGLHSDIGQPLSQVPLTNKTLAQLSAINRRAAIGMRPRGTKGVVMIAAHQEAEQRLSKELFTLQENNNWEGITTKLSKVQEHNNSLRTKKKTTPLTAEETASIINIKELVNTRNEKGNALLHYAVLKRERSVVGKLLVMGADPNLTNADGNTALHLALMSCCYYTEKNKDYNIVTSLLEKGANPKALNQQDHSPLYIANTLNDTAMQEILEKYGGKAVNLSSENAPRVKATPGVERSF